MEESTALPPFRGKKGFTLAEVLITLAVIGVVSAMTIPPVVKNHKAVSGKASFEEAFVLLSRSVKRMNAEEGKLPTADSYPAHSFKPTFMKYVRVLKDCGLGWSDKDSSVKPCVQRKLKENPVSGTDAYMEGYKTFSRNQPLYGEFLDDGQIILVNGMYIFIENNVSTIYVTIDTNGYVKKPNLWGHDVFTFQLMNDGTVLPMGAPGTKYTDKNTYCSKTSASTINGIACAYQAAMDPNYFKNLP